MPGQDFFALFSFFLESELQGSCGLDQSACVRNVDVEQGNGEGTEVAEPASVASATLPRRLVCRSVEELSRTSEKFASAGWSGLQNQIVVVRQKNQETRS